MRYCLSIGLHNLYFDIAIVDENHNIVVKNRILYDRSKDVSNNIFNAYQKHFKKYKLEGIGISVSSNIEYKDDVIYKIKALNVNRYNLKQAMKKAFKMDVLIIEERYAASIGAYKGLDAYSLMYVILDNKICNSIVVDGEILLLDEDIDLLKNKILNDLCSKNTLKSLFLEHNLDDEYVGGYFLSNNSDVKKIINNWAKDLNKYLMELLKSLKVEQLMFAGNLGVYYPYFKEYLTVDKYVRCDCVNDHIGNTIIGISHLIFKDN